MKKKNLIKVLLGLILILVSVGFVEFDIKSDGLKVSFYVDGSVYAVVDAVANETISMPTDPTKAGYTFKEWLLDGEKFEPDTVIIADITLYAFFTANSVT